MLRIQYTDLWMLQQIKRLVFHSNRQPPMLVILLWLIWGIFRGRDMLLQQTLERILY
jgi:hypothetical protein